MKTIEVLRRWVEGDAKADGLLVSPRNLRALAEGLSAQDQNAAFSPEPTIPPLTDILVGTQRKTDPYVDFPVVRLNRQSRAEWLTFRH